MAIPLLTFGAFNLTDWSGSAYGTAVMASGTSRGNPVPIEVAVKSWLQDGSVAFTQGYDNREVAIRVQLKGPSLTNVAQAEAALVAELNKPNTLTWTPASGPASVFDVVTSSLDHDDTWDQSDIVEAQHNTRYYNLRLVCLPFVRSVTTFTSPGIAPGGSTTTTLDTCGSSTGWTGSIDGVTVTPTNTVGPPTTNSVSSASFAGTHTYVMQKTFAATTSTTNLLVVDWKYSGPAGYSNVLSAIGDGVVLAKYAEGTSPTSGYTRTWFKVAASSLAVTQFTLTHVTGLPIMQIRTFLIDNVAVTNAAPVAGTGRQQLRGLAVSGSSRTQASLAIESATAALGDGTIVYVYPGGTATAGYTPSLRQFRTSGNTVTTDSTKVSGSTEPLNGSAVQFDVPIGLFPPGLYLLVVRMTTAGTPTLSYGAKTTIGGNGVAQFNYSKALTATTGYQNVVIGRLTLPTIDLDPAAATASVSMTLTLQASTTTTYDEAWLFGTSFGQLTMVDCGTGSGAVGGSARRLFLEPPSVATPRPTIRIGHSADRSDSFYPTGLTCWQTPVLAPPQVNVLTVTPNATDAAVSISGYPRWHSHAAS